jgi:hypothetical protein
MENLLVENSGAVIKDSLPAILAYSAGIWYCISVNDWQQGGYHEKRTDYLKLTQEKREFSAAL